MLVWLEEVQQIPSTLVQLLIETETVAQPPTNVAHAHLEACCGKPLVPFQEEVIARGRSLRPPPESRKIFALLK
jgi:hypothetical protein